ncbi:tautomerase family protein [Saccharibacillus sacchari]|uniref:Tautomerase family protein n=1 Tax=Saccharibacillus sacchari TaxID=456493 RepID=A0ACC6PCP6_9BACL
MLPFVRTSYSRNHYDADQLRLCAETLLESLIEHFRIPPDDFFHVFHAIEPGEFFFSPRYLSVERSEALLYIEVTLACGRSSAQKQAFYKDAADRLAARCNIRREDVFIVLSETQLENWSFGLGRAQMIETPPTWLRSVQDEESACVSALTDSAGADYARVSPSFAEHTRTVLFGEIWKDPTLSPRERSLVTLAALVSEGALDQIPFHIQLAQAHGLTQTELSAAFSHLAFYAGWPRAASALKLLGDVEHHN